MAIPVALITHLQFPNAVVLNAVVRRNTQMSAKERKRKSAKEHKRAQKGAKERKRALLRKNCKQMPTTILQMLLLAGGMSEEDARLVSAHIGGAKRRWRIGYRQTTRLMRSTRGYPQGDALSVAMCNVLLSMLARRLEGELEPNGGVIYYLDDLLISAQSVDVIERADALVQEFMMDMGLQLNVAKTVYMKAGGGDVARALEMKYKMVDEFRYLGCYFATGELPPQAAHGKAQVLLQGAVCTCRCELSCSGYWPHIEGGGSAQGQFHGSDRRLRCSHDALKDLLCSVGPSASYAPNGHANCHAVPTSLASAQRR